MGRGALVFKGDKVKKKKKAKHELQTKPTDIKVETIALSEPAARSEPVPESKAVAAPKIQNGSGQITTSGSVVTGHGTRFNKELQNGDAFLVDINGNQEMRVVTMRLSDISLNLSSAFSENLSRPVSFQYIKKPKDKAKLDKNEREKRENELKEQERHASGSYGSSTKELVYQEKTASGSYRIRREQIDDDKVTRTELLEMRSKKKRDKYC